MTYWRMRTCGRYGEVTSSRLICKTGGRVDFHLRSLATILALSSWRVSFEILLVPYLFEMSGKVKEILKEINTGYNRMEPSVRREKLVVDWLCLGCPASQNLGWRKKVTRRVSIGNTLWNLNVGMVFQLWHPPYWCGMVCLSEILIGYIIVRRNTWPSEI